jgi:hypothetical protein
MLGRVGGGPTRTGRLRGGVGACRACIETGFEVLFDVEMAFECKVVRVDVWTGGTVSVCLGVNKSFGRGI